MTQSDGRLSRWSRRKMKARRGRPEIDPEDVAAEPVAPSKGDEPDAQLSPEEEADVLRKLDLPAPESLKAGDDFTKFLKEGVPDQIRRRALRLLWRSNPLLANVDGLVDYGEDFTDAATVIDNLKTVFVVGHGARPIEEEPEPSPPAEDSAAAAGAQPLPEEGPAPDDPIEAEGTAPNSENSENSEEVASGNRDAGQGQELLHASLEPAIDAEVPETDSGSEPLTGATVRRGMRFRFDD